MSSVQWSPAPEVPPSPASFSSPETDLSLASAASPPLPGAEEEQETPGFISYDEPGLLEVELEDRLYRLDSGKQGTALCLSVRAVGTYRFRFLGELRWDRRDLRSKSVDRKLLGQLSRHLRELPREEG